MTPWAQVFDEPGRPFRRQSFTRPVLQPGEVLVRIRLTTLCGSDLHTCSGRRQEKTPVVLGHEMVGEIEELGPGHPISNRNGESLSPGDRVVWAVAVACGHCFFCRHELPQKCHSLFKYGKAPVQNTVGLFGGLSTHCHLQAGTAIVSVPDSLPDSVAAPAMCAGATAFTAISAADITESRAVVIVTGLGLLGLTASAILASHGHVVIALDRDPTRLFEARKFGATESFRLPDETTVFEKRLHSLTEGRGADVLLEMSGASEPAQRAAGWLRNGGRLILVGAVFPGESIAISPEEIVRKCLTIRGVHNYRPADLQQVMDWLSQHHTQYPFAEVVSARFELQEIERAFRFAETKRPLRVGVYSGAARII